MNYEAISAWALTATLFVIATSAGAALIQLHHMRSGNHLVALIAIDEDFRSPELQQALRYVQRDLADHLSDPGYRAELEAIGFIDSSAHPELTVCNWFNKVGTLVKHRLITEDPFMDLFGRLVVHSWTHVSPAIAIMRRSRGQYQYHDFEYLANRAHQWLTRHPAGLYPRQGRVPIDDRWLPQDHPEAAYAVTTSKGSTT